jgi:hypothetical protein
MFPVLVTIIQCLREEEAESGQHLVMSGVPTHRTPRFFPGFTRTLPARREIDSRLIRYVAKTSAQPTTTMKHRTFRHRFVAGA